MCRGIYCVADYSSCEGFCPSKLGTILPVSLPQPRRRPQREPYHSLFTPPPAQNIPNTQKANPNPHPIPATHPQNQTKLPHSRPIPRKTNPKTHKPTPAPDSIPTSPESDETGENLPENGMRDPPYTPKTRQMTKSRPAPMLPRGKTSPRNRQPSYTWQIPGAASH